MPEKEPSAYHDKLVRIFIMPYEALDKQIVVIPRGLKKFTAQSFASKIVKNGDGYSVSLAIPLAGLELDPQTRNLLGFEVAVDNADGGKVAEQQLLWSSSGAAYKNRLDMGFLILK